MHPIGAPRRGRDRLEAVMTIAMSIDPELGKVILDTLTQHRPDEIRRNFQSS